MITDQNDDQLLDRIVAALRAQPIPEGPPDYVRHRVMKLGECTLRPTLIGSSAHRAWLADWIRTAAVAVALFVVLDIGWSMYVNATTPVGWFRDPATDTWQVLYNSTRLEICRPSAEIRKGA